MPTAETVELLDELDPRNSSRLEEFSTDDEGGNSDDEENGGGGGGENENGGSGGGEIFTILPTVSINLWRNA